MNKSDENNRLKKAIRNYRAPIKRRDETIARLKAENAQLRKEKEAYNPKCGYRFSEYGRTIPGHQFSEFVVRYAVFLRIVLNHGSRSIVETIKILSKLTYGLVDNVPSPNTVDNWARKCGLDEIMRTPQAFTNKDYAAIMDECMMIGSEKLLPVLAVPAEHQGRPLQLSDVKIVKFHVRSGWTAQTANDVFKESASIMGKAPKYVITDNDSKMRKAVELSSYTWHRDVSHTLAMFMERTYKEDPEFQDFNKRLAMCKRQNCMKEIAYLQPPSQRTKARFMNLTDTVGWAGIMLMQYHGLESQVREAFSYLPMYSSFIEEMKEMVSCIHYIESRMKQQGLSKETIRDCKRHVCMTIMRRNDRMRRVGQQILDYLAKENRHLKDDGVQNNSSDIIESMFGIFKYIQSPNKMNGVTTLVLHLPVRLSMDAESAPLEYKIKERLYRIKIRDITLWRNQNLMENQVAKRIRTLKTA